MKRKDRLPCCPSRRRTRKGPKDRSRLREAPCSGAYEGGKGSKGGKKDPYALLQCPNSLVTVGEKRYPFGENGLSLLKEKGSPSAFIRRRERHDWLVLEGRGSIGSSSPDGSSLLDGIKEDRRAQDGGDAHACQGRSQKKERGNQWRNPVVKNSAREKRKTAERLGVRKVPSAIFIRERGKRKGKKGEADQQSL